MRQVSVMQQRHEMVLAVRQRGISVSGAAALFGVSRQTVHKWLARYDAEGVEGLGDRSSRPLVPSGQVDGGLEQRVVQLRTANPRWGPKRIHAELVRRGVDPPARSTIGRILARNGLTGDHPRPVPAAPLRFARERPNELWQIDGMRLAVGEETMTVITLLDDHSRLCLGLLLAAGETAAAAIAAFDRAVSLWGLPHTVLSDNGSAFTARSKGGVGPFERHLWQQGVATINGRPYHPQTQGKVERLHRTLREWLTDHPAEDAHAMTDQLDAFVDHYNTQRPHQALNDRTPAQVHADTPPARPNPAGTLHKRSRRMVNHTQGNGNLGYASWQIGLGRAHPNTVVAITDHGDLIEIHDEHGTLIGTTKPDPTTRYLPLTRHT